MIIKPCRFRKASFSKSFLSSLKRKASVVKFSGFKSAFGKLRFRDGLVLVFLLLWPIIMRAITPYPTENQAPEPEALRFLLQKLYLSLS